MPPPHLPSASPSIVKGQGVGKEARARAAGPLSACVALVDGKGTGARSRKMMIIRSYYIIELIIIIIIETRVVIYSELS